MNKKGFVISSSIFIIMMITSIILTMAYRPMLNTRQSLHSTKMHMIELIEKRNALERMHGMIFSNSITSGEVNFEDYGIEAVYINENNGAPTETVSASSDKGGEVSLEIELTPDTLIQLTLDYTVSWNEGVQYPPGISRYSFELIHETLGVMPLESINTEAVVGAVILTIDPAEMPLGNYTVRVTPTKVDVTIQAEYQLIVTDQKVLQLYKDGVLIHTQYIK